MKSLFAALLICFPFISIAQPPPGHIAHYMLDNDLTDNGGNSYNGTLTSASGTTNRFGDANKATAFVQGSSTGQLPVGLQTAIQNSFSLSFWFRSSMTASSSSQWYGGNALVDAEMCGGTADWGTALVDGGKVCFGIGNPDITIKSSLDYNDGNWHFVTANRDHVAGSITLYVDGAQVATTAGTSTSARVAPTSIGIGRNPCAATPQYTGSLDEIIIYDRALTGSETTNLYNFSVSTTLPLSWVSFSGKAKENSVTLNWEVANMVNNDYFEIEYAANGQSFTKAATVSSNAVLSNYSYTLNNLANGNYQFRIKQVDIDKKYAYSKIIALAVNGSHSSMSIFRNPARNELVIMNPAMETVQQLIITDISGKRVQAKNTNAGTTAIKTTIAGLKNGYYQVTLVTQKSSITLPFIKQ